MIDFDKIFEEAFRRKFYKDRENRSTEHNHPSEMTNCPRQFWYRINKAPVTDEPSLSMMLIWAMGHAIQSIFEDLMWDIPEFEDFIIEYPLHDTEHNLGGSSDLVVRVKANRKWYVLDFKTTGATQFKEIQKKGVPEAYRWQVNLYMYMLKKAQPKQFESLDTAYLFFINKSPIPDEIFQAQGKPWLAKSPFYVAEIKYDEDLLETEILPQAEYLEEIRKQSTPPDKTEGESCKFCEFRTLCKKGDKSGK